ncbi:HNH endonuclease [Salipiger mangrovisoli]|uniref:HNH endonuclease n=1 Tax=Salipiger mangrovisoli TaxID=2865933 RepID=A0ABR9X1T7_9RHOB|nr:HNH endonuclease [Salipiger mangrovisoli]MBE9637406.1 HNH endonuclease [Salipiger mangrovisoli]
MAQAVFIRNPESIYRDEPGLRYNLPNQCLGMVKDTLGDWVVVYEGKRGAFGNVAVQKVVAVEPDPLRVGWHFAVFAPETLLQFETTVPRASADGLLYERRLQGPDGRAYSGGLNTSAVRRLTPAEFAAIVNAGLAEIEGADALPRLAEEEQAQAFQGFAEETAPFGAPPLKHDRTKLLGYRPYREQAFQRMVKRAYDSRCAISGLQLRNGGGRPEVQAAHIRPVRDKGPDIVANGLALSGTLHWMFDRGLIGIAEDHTILISHNKVPEDVVRRLIVPGQKLLPPASRRDYPHPEFLRYHREHIFGQMG